MDAGLLAKLMPAAVIELEVAEVAVPELIGR